MDLVSFASKRRPRLPMALVDAVLGRCPPFIGARTITAALRLAGAKISPSTLFWGLPELVGEGDYVSRLEIGELCGLNFGCYFELAASITLEPHVAVGHEVMLLTRTHDPTRASHRGEPSVAKPIRVGAGSWLGSRCVVLPGVTIGPGSVVGASVVVREDLPANTMLAGTRRVSIAKWR
jgi:acetyltransferase-like isoleucine patch superfamily enzyme